MGRLVPQADSAPQAAEPQDNDNCSDEDGKIPEIHDQNCTPDRPNGLDSDESEDEDGKFAELTAQRCSLDRRNGLVPF